MFFCLVHQAVYTHAHTEHAEILVEENFVLKKRKEKRKMGFYVFCQNTKHYQITILKLR